MNPYELSPPKAHEAKHLETGSASAALLTSRRRALTAAASLAVIPACWFAGAAQARPLAREPDLTRVDPQRLEASAAAAYFAQMQQLEREGKLAPESDPHLRRTLRITDRMVAIAPRFNPRAAGWDWRVNLINDSNSRIGGWSMAGGKMAISSSTRNWSDDELAALMGHEVAHCLLEHSRESWARELERRERLASSERLNRWLDSARRIEQQVGLDGVTDAASAYAFQAATMHYRREDELEATNLGLELMARIGMDPRAAVALWVPPSSGGRKRSGLFDTHPTSWRHGKEITEAALPRVMPIYEAVISGRSMG